MITWLSDIEKEINAKKVGLVFKAHWETIFVTIASFMNLDTA
jgi:hypothetical protein